MKSGLLLDIVVSQRATIIQLLAGKDESLLVGRNAFLILNLRLHALNRVRRLHVQSYSLARERLHEDLHSIMFYR